jgi:hypothetical protein
MPKHPLTGLAFLTAVLITATSCDERPSGDAGVDQEADQTGTIDDTAPPDQVETDRDPTPQTGRGGAIPETDEGSSY